MFDFNSIISFVASRLLAKENDNYVHDPTHRHKPHGGGWHQTEKGWSKSDITEEKGRVQHIDMSKGRDRNGDSGFVLDKSQLNSETLITDANGVTKKYGDMNASEKKAVEDTIKVIGSFSLRGFSDYSRVDAGTFHANMKRNLDFVDTGTALGENTSKARLNERTYQHFEATARENLDRVIDKYHPAVNSRFARKALDDYKDKVLDVVKRAVEDGSIGEMTENSLDSFLQEDMKRLIYQEMETRRRSMGDHGIRHLVGNAISTVDILDKLREGGVEKGTTGRDMLIGMICQVNHDIGYTVGTVATDGRDGTFHKSHSGVIADEEYDRYESLLGKDGADILVGKKETYEGTDVHKRKASGLADKGLFENPKPETYKDGRQKTDKDGNPLWSGVLKKEVVEKLGPSDLLYQQSKEFSSDKPQDKGAIPYHDDANYDWKNNALRSAIALADCTALFGKDKVQELFLENDDAMEQTVKMHEILSSSDFSDEQKQRMFDKYKQKLKNIVSRMEVPELDKQMMVSQIEEASSGIKSFNTVEDILTRASGSLDGYEYDSKAGKVIVNTSYSRSGEVLEDMFGDKLARKQWDKACKGDFGGISAQSITDGQARTVYGREGYGVEIRINSFVNDEVDNKGVERADRALGSRRALRELARLGVYAERAAAGARNEKEHMDAFAALAERMGEYNAKSAGRKSKGEELFGSNWERVKELVKNGRFDDLRKIPFSEEEKAYLSGIFASAVGGELKYAGIARKVMGRIDDTLTTVKLTIPDSKVFFLWKSDGNVVLYDGGSNHGWETDYPLEGDAGKRKFCEMFKRTSDVLHEKGAEAWMKVSKLSWRKRY